MSPPSSSGPARSTATVQVTGENDGVNGFEWSAMHVLAHGTVPVPVEVHREVLIDGITPAEELA
jgi:hypothetical protein